MTNFVHDGETEYEFNVSPSGAFLPCHLLLLCPDTTGKYCIFWTSQSSQIYILPNFLGVGGNGLLADSSCGVLGSRQKKSDRGFTFFQNSQNHYQSFAFFWNSQNHNYGFGFFKAHKIIYNFAILTTDLCQRGWKHKPHNNFNNPHQLELNHAPYSSHTWFICRYFLDIFSYHSSQYLVLGISWKLSHSVKTKLHPW